MSLCNICPCVHVSLCNICPFSMFYVSHRNRKIEKGIERKRNRKIVRKKDRKIDRKIVRKTKR